MDPQPTTAATPLEALAARAGGAGHEPWLFYRDGWDWSWRSWRRVADHVARGAAALRAAAGTRPEAQGRAQPPRAGFAARQHPDAIAAGLALQAAGWLAVPVAGGPRAAAALGCELWVEVGSAAGGTPDPGVERVELPPARSQLAREELQPLVPDAASAAGAVQVTAGEPAALRAPAAAGTWIASARRFDRRLPALPGRPIVCAADLGPDVAQLLEAWTLIRGAAWVLEPQADAFVETVIWARPTVIWARDAELEQLAARISSRKQRRRSRVSCVVVAGGEAAGAGSWRELGVEVVALGQIG